jgi:uroporphyrinogen-III synthase
MRVIVTRPAAEAAEWLQALRSRGFDAIGLPLIEIAAPADPLPLQRAWARIDSYRAAMFVSANAVRGFFAAKMAGTAFGARAWATGAGTRNALLAAGVPAAQVDSPPADAAQFDSEALWEVVQHQCEAGCRVLLVRGGEGRDWLGERLLERGVAVETVMAYSRRRPQWDAAQEALAASASGDAWLFSSSEAIANLRALAPQLQWRSARAIATHPRIAQAARDAGFGVVCESRPAVPDVVAALESAG